MLALLSDEARADLVRLIDERVQQHLASAAHVSAESTHWLTVSEAADLMRTTAGAIYKRIKRGQLAAHHPQGSRILLRRDDLVTTGPSGSAVL